MKIKNQLPNYLITSKILYEISRRKYVIYINWCDQLYPEFVSVFYMFDRILGCSDFIMFFFYN